MLLDSFPIFEITSVEVLAVVKGELSSAMFAISRHMNEKRSLEFELYNIGAKMEP